MNLSHTDSASFTQSQRPDAVAWNEGDGQKQNVVVCDALTKRYGDFVALDRCTLTVRQGDVFGLLGPNGAGKTTLLRSLLGFLQTSDGSATVCGNNPSIDPVKVRQCVAYLPGDARLPRHMRGDGVLKFFADIHPQGDLKRSRQIAEALELDTSRRVGMMSTGMRQKLALSVVLSPRTPLLILDEPTANLDPSVRAVVLEFVREAHRDGRTVMLSSHVLSEIEETCNRVAFLRRGVLAKELRMADLFQRHRVWGEVDTQGFDLAVLHQRVPADLTDSVLIQSRGHTDKTTLLCIDTAGDLARLLSWLATLQLRQMRIEPLGLRAVYDSVHFNSEGVGQENEAGDQVASDAPEVLSV